MVDTSSTPESEYTYEYTEADIPNYTVSGDTIKNLVGGIINYDGINTTGSLFNSFDTRGGGKTKKSKAKSAKSAKAKSAKATKAKSAKTVKTTKTSKTAKTTKTSKTAKSIKSTINDVKIPKKIIMTLFE